jgi:hypothetical protein
MKRITLLTLFIFAASLSIYAQDVFLIKDYMEVDPSIDDDVQLQIIEMATKIINDYNESASFLDETGKFSDKKYADFIDLFSGGAKVYDDLMKKPTNIDYSIYADKVFQFMQEVGVRFTLNNVYVENIIYDNTGFYVVNLDVEKIMYNGLDDSNYPVDFKNGKTFNLKMKIDMPDYDVSQAKIQGLAGEEISVVKQTISNMSLTGFYGYGINVSKKSTDPSFSDDLSSTLSSFGGEFDYRRSLNSNQSLFLLAGIRGHQLNFNSTLGGVFDTVPDNINAKLNGSAPIDLTVESTKILSNLTDASEKMNTLFIEVPLGISYRLINKFNYDLFLDAAIVPMFSVNSGGKVNAQMEFVNLPTDLSNFPVDPSTYDADVEALKNYLAGNDEVLAIYFPSEKLDKVVSTNPNFSLGLLIAPTFHYDLNFRYGIEFGITYWMNILPLFKDNSDDSFSDYLKGNNPTYPSILENFYEGVTASTVAVKLGIFYKFE